MLRQEVYAKNPIRILEKTAHGGLGRKNAGAIAARRGEGKTACLVHFAIDALLQEKRVLHVSFSDHPDHIYSWYDEIWSALARAYNLAMASDVHDEIASNRMILNFNSKKLTTQEIEKRIVSTLQGLEFKPDLILVDGYPFLAAGPEILGEFKDIASKLDAELWVSLTLEENAPASLAQASILNPLLPSLAVLISLENNNQAVLLRLLRDHDRDCVEDTHVRLDPKSLLLIQQ